MAADEPAPEGDLDDFGVKIDQFRLRRPGQLDLVFDGELLAGVSSRLTKPRWTEINLYRTAVDCRYVVEVIGRSTVRGETDRVTVTVHDRPHGVVEALKVRPGKGRPRLTELALDALNKAAELDFALGEAEYERIS